MRKTLVVLVAIILIGSINSYAAFPTFVWTEENRSELYAVEMAEDGVDDTTATTDAESITAFLVFDSDEDGLSTPTDLDEKEPSTDEGMNIAADEEEESDSIAQSITSYEIEPVIEKDDTEPEQEG